MKLFRWYAGGYDMMPGTLNMVLVAALDEDEARDLVISEAKEREEDDCGFLDGFEAEVRRVVSREPEVITGKMVYLEILR